MGESVTKSMGGEGGQETDSTPKTRDLIQHIITVSPYFKDL